MKALQSLAGVHTHTHTHTHTHRGISLIVLVITIIVIIILAAAVILTLNKNNPIENANKATFVSNMKTFQEELNMYHAKNYTSSVGEYQKEGLSADASGISYSGTGSIDTKGNIADVITSLKGSKYQEEVSVEMGSLSFSGTNPKEIAWAAEVGVITDVSLNGINSPNMLAGMIPV
ncbi:MAG: hypothetical protein RSE50_12925, partial [Myroides sp.]